MNRMDTNSVFARRFKFKMGLCCGNLFRPCRNVRGRDLWKYTQVLVTVLIIAYFAAVILDDTVTKDKREDKQQKEDVSHITVPTEGFDEKNELYKAFNLQSESQSLQDHKQNEEITGFRRLDTTAELTEKLPFLPEYKSPCWKEVDEIFAPDEVLRCLPYFYVVGVSHCGTIDLFSRLVMHPQISENVKPGNRWLTRLRFAGFPNLSDYLQFYYKAVELDIKRIKSANGSYNAIFGDFTPSVIWDNNYLIGAAKKKNMTEPPYTNADVIKHLNPNARIIILVCDPTERLYTDYLHFTSDGTAKSVMNLTRFHEHVINTVNKFSSCLTNNTLKHCVYFGKPWGTTFKSAGLTRMEIGLYYLHIQNFLDIFPKDQIMVIRKESYYKNIFGTLQDVFKFLGIDPVTDPDLKEDMISRAVGQGDDKKTGNMLPETRRIVQNFYKPYNDRLKDLLGPDFDFNANAV